MSLSQHGYCLVFQRLKKKIENMYLVIIKYLFMIDDDLFLMLKINYN